MIKRDGMTFDRAGRIRNTVSCELCSKKSALSERRRGVRCHIAGFSPEQQVLVVPGSWSMRGGGADAPGGRVRVNYHQGYPVWFLR